MSSAADTTTTETGAEAPPRLKCQSCEANEAKLALQAKQIASLEAEVNSLRQEVSSRDFLSTVNN